MIGDEFSLKGKVGIVAGDSGLACSVAEALAEADAEVILAGRGLNAREVQDVQAAARRMGRRVVAVRTNIAQPRGAQAMVDKALAEFGRIDILVNTVDLPFGKPLVEVTNDEWRRVFDANLTAVFYCCRAVGQHLLQQKSGRIINIVSGLAVRGMSNWTAYCASKGGVLQLTRALALEWARANIRVNAIGTGWLSAEEVSEEAEKDPLIRYIPMRRKGKPSELGGLVVYLASDASDYVTGHLYVVDGGVLAHA